MTTPREPELTDELLSAYIDDAVTPAERQLVEQTVASDPDVAWRLQSLQMTVHLLHELPALALPRSFALTPEQVGEPASALAPAAAPRQVAQPVEPGFWERVAAGWRTFWQGGSPALRNAMAMSLALLLVFAAAPALLSPPLGNEQMMQFAELVVAPAAAPAAENVAPAAESAAPAAADLVEEPAADEAGSAESAPAEGAIAKEASPMAILENARAAAATESPPESAAESAAEPVAAEVEQAAAPMAAEAADALAVAAAPAAAAEAAPLLAQPPGPADDPLAAARAGAPPAGGAEAGAAGSGPAMAAMAAPLPTATPSATATPLPTATSAPTPTTVPTATAASAALAQPTQTLPAVVPVDTAAAATWPWLLMAQFAAGAGFVIFGLLWWQSRR